ncbi:alpha/beta hydrolase [Microbacterium sp. P05]|uniref:alpha/beta hydrolase n=1 Tax=Microbacterium sp. P05 TaxID=3366948 RepID=UPI0037450D73
MKPQKVWVRRVWFAMTALLAGLATAFGTYGLSVQPGAAIVKAVFEAKPEVTGPAGFDALSESVSTSEQITIPTPSAPPAGLTISRPAAGGAVPLPVVLWIHGGGFISSSADTVADYVTILASHGYVVANLDYSLAPGSQHPVPVLQAEAALGYLVQHAADYGGDPGNIVLGGDSAGAQIASEVAALETNPQLAASLRTTPALEPAQLRGVILFCGLYDMQTVGSTGFPALRTYLWAYTGYRDWTRYPAIDDLSTTNTATSAFPPTFLSVGDADPFRTQAIELASALDQRAVAVTTLFWDGTGDGLGHEYQFDFSQPQAQTALDATLGFLVRVTTEGPVKEEP